MNKEDKRKEIINILERALTLTLNSELSWTPVSREDALFTCSRTAKMDSLEIKIVFNGFNNRPYKLELRLSSDEVAVWPLGRWSKERKIAKKIIDEASAIATKNQEARRSTAEEEFFRKISKTER